MATSRRASRRKIKRSPFLGFCALAALVGLSMAATVYFIFLRPGTHPPQPQKKSPTQHSAKLKKDPYPETTSISRQKKEAPPSAQTPLPVVLPDKKSPPQLALVIDDIGHKKTIAEQLVNLDLNLTFSILPHTPHGLTLARKAQEKGHDILLHLPMEATDKKWDPGPGALFLKMNRVTMQQMLLKDLQAVPMAIGINNHMGSLFSENRHAMTLFLQELQKTNLFFLDSLTSSKSVGYQVAKELGVKTVKRDIFLDNERDTAKTVQQIKRLIKIAKKHGQAIGIGHPYPTTLAALSQTAPQLKSEVSLTTVRSLSQ